jgi:hypothetical protein
MAANVSDTIFSEFSTVVQNCYHLLDKSGNISREIKSGLKTNIGKMEKIFKDQINVLKNKELESNDSSDSHIDCLQSLNKRLESIEKHLMSKSYANAVSSGQQTIEDKTKYMVIIKPMDKKMSSKDTENILKTRVQTKDLKIGIKSKKYISNGGIIIECRSAEECQHLSQEVEDRKIGLIAEKPMKRRPRLILFDVNTDMNETQLLDHIINNNNAINDYMKDKCEDISRELEIKFKFRKRDPNLNDKYCIEVSPQLRKIIMKTKRLFIGWNSCRIEDSLPIIRCFKCNAFGHKSNECSLEHDQCGHCGKSHETKTCQASNEMKKCVNCIKHNLKPYLKKKFETNHSSFDNKCESFIRIQEIVKSKISYE